MRDLLVLLSRVTFFNLVSYQTFSRLNSFSCILVSNSTCAISSSNCSAILFSVLASYLYLATRSRYFWTYPFRTVFSFQIVKAFWRLYSPYDKVRTFKTLRSRWDLCCFASCSSFISLMKLSSPFYFSSSHSLPTMCENSFILRNEVWFYFLASFLRVKASIFLRVGSFWLGIYHSYSDSVCSEI